MLWSSGRREIAGRQLFVKLSFGKPACDMRQAKGGGLTSMVGRRGFSKLDLISQAKKPKGCSLSIVLSPLAPSTGRPVCSVRGRLDGVTPPVHARFVCEMLPRTNPIVLFHLFEVDLFTILEYGRCGHSWSNNQAAADKAGDAQDAVIPSVGMWPSTVGL